MTSDSVRVMGEGFVRNQFHIGEVGGRCRNDSGSLTASVVNDIDWRDSELLPEVPPAPPPLEEGQVGVRNRSPEWVQPDPCVGPRGLR